MNELTISLDVAKSEYLYEQIYEYIKNEIITGKLLANEKLPSTRLLASHLQVSRSTVDLAYAQLADEGYIRAIAYKGFFVCDLIHVLTIGDSNVERKHTQDKSEEAEYNFSPYGVEMKEFPFSTYKKIMKEVIDDRGGELFHLGDKQGDKDFRETICKYLHSARGVNCEAYQIVIGAGNDYLLMLLCKILGENLNVVMEKPTYMKAYHVFNQSGYQVKTIPIGETNEEVMREANLAYVMPSHQFPTGMVTSIGKRLELLEWANREGRYIIEDDYDSEFRYKGKPIPALQGIDKKGHVIYIGTFSKSIGPATRISYMVLPKELLPRFEATCGFLSNTVPRVDQEIINRFIKYGYFERYLNRMRKIYGLKHDMALSCLKKNLQDFQIKGEKAGLHFVLSDKKNRDEEQLISLAKEKGVHILGMKAFYPLEDFDGEKTEIILGYGTIPIEKIEAGIKKLQDAFM